MKFCKEKGIRRKYTTSYTSKQNGIAERIWKSLYEMTCAMLKESKLGNEWWGRAIITAAFLKNCCLSGVLKEDITPFELVFDRKPDLSVIRTFGCKVFAHIPKEKYYKLDNHAKEGIFMGYGEKES